MSYRLLTGYLDGTILSLNELKFQGGRRDGRQIMRFLKLEIENYQIGAGDAFYLEPLLPQILSNFTGLIEAYQIQEGATS